MKRYLCLNHKHFLRTEGKSIQLSTDNCSICRWRNRPLKLADFARELEGISAAVRESAENPDYDPFGYTTFDPLGKILARYYKIIGEGYKKRFIETIIGKEDETK